MALLKPLLRATRDVVYRIVYRGSGRWCPVCERPARRFAPFGNPRRAQAMCPHCGALERHRLLALFFEKKTNLYTQPHLRMLHVAPEPCFESRLRARVGAGYLTADLADPHVDVRMDITQIQYPDATFDFFRSLIRTTPRRSPHRDVRPKAYDQHSKVEQLRSLIIDD